MVFGWLFGRRGGAVDAPAAADTGDDEALLDAVVSGMPDAAMLVALIEYDKEQLVAGLLLFRLLYYIVPFALSLLILGARELWLGIAARK